MDKIEPDALSAMGEMWQKMFADDAFNLVELAAQKHISTNKFFPSIAEIRTQMAQLMRPDLIPPEQAWEIVHKYYFAYSTSESALPALIFSVTEIESRYIKEHLTDGLGRKLFMEQYKPLYDREFEKACLPKAIRERIEKGNNYLGGETIKQISAIEDAANERKNWIPFYKNEKRYEPCANSHIEEAIQTHEARTRAKYANL